MLYKGTQKYTTTLKADSQNIQPLIDAMNRLQQTSSRTNITINGIDVIGNQSNNAIDAINRLMNTLTQLQNTGGMQSFNQVNVIGRQTLKEMNREAKKMEKTREIARNVASRRTIFVPKALAI